MTSSPKLSSSVLFLSTPSARRATADRRTTGKQPQISIHALREEGDADPRPQCPPDHNFYPRPPRGGRLCVVMVAKAYSEISIHALREEGDPRNCCSPRRRRRFLSTPSARRATLLVPYIPAFHNDFYPRPPRGGRRHHTDQVYRFTAISIHALREEGDARRRRACTAFP